MQISRLRHAALAAVLITTACSLFRQPPPPAEGFTTAEGLELTVWAQEPLLINPTNIDIDSRGRVWALEAINYRRHLKSQPDLVPEGDRIVILEDTDGDGRADSRKVFDQNPELRSPLGIAVLGDKVVVSQSPNVWVYTKDENDTIVAKEVLLSGWGGYDHDHGVHAITFGHDGRYYFNNGDQGFDLTDKSGKRFVNSPDGPYFAGTALRVNPDGTDFAVLGHNFRNPYELVHDSFGTVWQTDNDDDGNKWTRLNYVMEGGNFGYWGPGGRRWREDHGSHFHEELPGVVPNIARTGPGSPTGLVVYEGGLLPEKYRGNLIHSEPGKRLILAFLLSPEGAGYKMEVDTLVKSDDPNFRPSDVVTAPDGSLYISDWYDPVVGGHNMNDTEKGRIYRLAPPKHVVSVPEVDLKSDGGLSAALRSPAQSVRYLGYTALREKGQQALPVVTKMWRESDPVGQARALWLLAQLGGEGRFAIDAALKHSDPRFRILGLRAARFANYDMLATTAPLLNDPSSLVRREIALALQFIPGEESYTPWIELAKQYDNNDRWYLEALAIGARGKENALYSHLRQEFPDGLGEKLGKLLWVLHPGEAEPYLTQTLKNPRSPNDERGRALAALAAMPSKSAGTTVAQIAASPAADVALREQAIEALSKQLFSQWIDLRESPQVTAAIRAGLGIPQTQATALRLVEDLGGPKYAPQLLALAQSPKAPLESRALALRALGRTGEARYLPTLRTSLNAPEAEIRIAALQGIAQAKPDDLAVTLETVVLGGAPNEVRSEALRLLARAPEGLARILDLEESKKLPGELVTLGAQLARASRDEAIKARAATVFPQPQGTGVQVTSVRDIVEQPGDAPKGREVFFRKDGPKCSSCHSLDSANNLAGPNLAAIGEKLGKEGLLDAIMNPSAGIGHEYYSWVLETRDQGTIIGILAEDTPEQVIVRTETGEEIRLKPGEITGRRQSKVSMMPADLLNHMTERELVDLLEFLSTLRAN